ncbi:TetR family transcriptional regulator [Saccharopolyspora sp. CA-218241]|uniref:TetR family transcriptional regulator n=1 Tax=Saccharopolyspora sp. CA-218241 TaxID=3240027 RepID=UPI003D996526
MPRTAEGRPAAEPSSPGQRARRRKILDVAARLGAAEGIDVQMHQVARLSGVALGTLYRYFPSKTHLFVGVLAQRTDRMAEALGRRTPVSADPVERVVDLLARATRSLLRTPRLANAMIQSNNAADPSVVTESAAIDAEVSAMLLRAAGIGDPTDRERVLVRLLQHAWYGILQTNLNGRSSVAAAEADLRLACRALLGPLAERGAGGGA